jgi:formylglycine-generating enzyme required for sulfatase activity
MKTKFILALIALLPLFSFLKKSNNENKVLPKDYRKSFSYIPNGEVEINNGKQDVNAFFLSKTEVTNLEYRTFLNELKSLGKTAELAIAQIDTTGWHMQHASYEPFVIHYHSHPAYNPYPVCNVSYEGALLYCEWLENKINECSKDKSIQYDVYIPSRAEWIRAANGNSTSRKYAWGGPECRNAKGCYLANFNTQEDNASVTCIAFAYAPGEYDTYCMNGNVAEMVSEKGIAVGGSWLSKEDEITNTSFISYTSSAPSIGFRVALRFKHKP